MVGTAWQVEKFTYFAAGYGRLTLSHGFLERSLGRAISNACTGAVLRIMGPLASAIGN